MELSKRVFSSTISQLDTHISLLSLAYLRAVKMYPTIKASHLQQIAMLHSSYLWAYSTYQLFVRSLRS